MNKKALHFCCVFSVVKLFILCSGLLFASNSGLDQIMVSGEVVEAESVITSQPKIYFHPRAVSGLMIELSAGESATFHTPFKGRGVLFIRGMTVGVPKNNSVVVSAGKKGKSPVTFSSKLKWSEKLSVDYINKTIIINMPEEQQGRVMIDRMFFTADPTTLICSDKKRNDLIAWGKSSKFSEYLQGRKNLVLNGDFETPLGPEWSLSKFSPFFLSESNLEKEVSDSGQRYLRIMMDRYTGKTTGITLGSGVIATGSAFEYSFSYRLRGKGIVSSYVLGSWSTLHKEPVPRVDYKILRVKKKKITLTDEWQQFSASFKGGGNVTIQFDLPADSVGGGNYLDIDDVVIRRKGARETAVSEKIAAGVVLPGSAGIFTEGKSLSSQLICRFGEDFSGSLKLRVFDVFNVLTAEKSIAVSGKPGSTLTMPFILNWIDPKPCGAYRMEIWHGKDLLKEQSFSVLPAALGRDKSSGLFGVISAAGKEVVPVIKRLGISSIASQNQGADLSKLKNIFKSETGKILTDTAYSKTFADAGLEVVATHHTLPSWLTPESDKAKLDHFKTKLTSWADSYNGSISAVLGWMELRQFDDEVFYQNLAAASSTALASAKQQIDFYIGAGTPEQAERFLNKDNGNVNGTAAYLKHMNDADLEGFKKVCSSRNKTLWSMEELVRRKTFYRHYMPYNSFHSTDWQIYSPAYSAALAIKSITRSVTISGAKRFFYFYMGPASTWYGWLYHNSLTLTDFDGSIHPLGVALAYLTSRLDGAEKTDYITRQKEVQIHAFENSRGATALLWSNRPEAASINNKVSSPWQLRDITGRRLLKPVIKIGQVPVFAVSDFLSSTDLVKRIETVIQVNEAMPVRFSKDNEGNIHLSINGREDFKARPAGFELPWMESARHNPVSAKWLNSKQGKISLNELSVGGCRTQSVEIKTVDRLWQYQVEVLASHPDRKIYSGMYDSIFLDSSINDLNLRRGRGKNSFDCTIRIDSNCSEEFINLSVRIVDDIIRHSESPDRGDALVLYLGADKVPVIIEPDESMFAGKLKSRIRMKSGEMLAVELTASKNDSFWQVEIKLPRNKLAGGRTDLPFAFEYRDSDDTEIQQKIIEWGKNAFNGQYLNGRIVLH
ncbi:MAG: hypothetical protein ACYTFY_11370 [Planctomycetota bacterium]|jgi:hypothetical protein